MKIALLEPLGVPARLIDELAAPVRAAGHTLTVWPDKTRDPAELIRRGEGCEVLMLANNPLPAEVLRALPDVRMLDVAFTGIDHIGLDACREQGITVCNAANYSNATVAEQVIGMAIALLRHFPEGDRAVRGGGTSAGLTGREIAGRTVGIIGTGRIGTLTARLFLAFGARVVAASRTEREDVRAMGVEYLPIDEVMRTADIVSLHTPNTAATRGLISRELIGLMKPGALFINCARGPIVDSAALADALNEGRIAGAGIDVYDCEPPIPADDPLVTAKHTLLMPHTAFLSEEAMVRRAHIVFENLAAWLDGRPQNVCEL